MDHLTGSEYPKSIKHAQTSSQQDHIPAIQRLYNDILHYIFSLNLYMDDNTTISDYLGLESIQSDTSLNDLRLLSHVCKSWRDLTLQSSSLWARSINLQLLDQRSDKWRRKVMRRTGDAPLSLRGIITPGRGATLIDFFLSILECDWARVRVLNITTVHTGMVIALRWQVLYRPAPNLEIFRLTAPRELFSTSSESSVCTPLFAGHAPALCHFCCNHPLFTPSSKTSWITQLHTLIVSGISTMTILQLFDILSCVPLIEVLEIYGQIDDSESQEVYSTLFPRRLGILKLGCSFGEATILMQHISTPIGCRFILNTSVRPSVVPSDEEISYLQCSIPRHFSSFIGFNSVKRLYWKLDGGEWDLRGDTSEEPEAIWQDIFRINISGDLQRMEWAFPLHLLSAFSECNLGDIRNLGLDVSCGFGETQPSNPILQSFLRRFSSVETIYTDSDTLKWLNNVLGPTTDIFPSLKHLVFVGGPELLLDPAAIMRFLLRRRELGVAIQTFDIQTCRSLHQELLLFLEGIDGLSVLWDPESQTPV